MMDYENQTQIKKNNSRVIHYETIQKPIKETSLNFFECSEELAKGPRFDNQKKVIRHSFVGDIDIFENNNNNKQTIPLNNMFKSASYNTHRYYKKEMVSPEIKVELNENDINKIYKNYVERINKNKEGMDKELVFHKTIQNNLHKQEKFFQTNTINIKSNSNVIKTICRKTRKNEDELIINNSPIYKLRSQLKEIIDIKKPKEGNFNINYWINNLRNPKEGEFQGTSFYLSHKDISPIWLGMKNEKTALKDFNFVRTNLDSKSLPHIKKFKESKFVMDTIKKYKINLTHFLDVSNVHVNGSNLLEEEKKIFNTIKGKKYFIYDKNKEVGEEEIIEQNYKKDKNKETITSLKECNYLKGFSNIKMRNAVKMNNESLPRVRSYC